MSKVSKCLGLAQTQVLGPKSGYCPPGPVFGPNFDSFGFLAQFFNSCPKLLNRSPCILGLFIGLWPISLVVHSKYTFFVLLSISSLYISFLGPVHRLPIFQKNGKDSIFGSINPKCKRGISPIGLQMSFT